MTTSSTLFVSTAIPFVNARPHLGFALELCIADALARHARARGAEVQFVTGTDDHSLKNVLAAERAHTGTSDFVAQQTQAFRELNAALGISADRFVQTSRSPSHAPAVRALWQACLARGDLYRGIYRGLYCVGCERFVEPHEQRCPEHAAPLEPIEENNWYFRLPRYGELLRDRIERAELALTSAEREETLAFLREPLRDLCVSRSSERARGWGLPVPGDPSQVIWVWFDALAYYLSALDFGSPDPQRFEHFWKDAARRVHVIGKGVTRFHAVIWPAILASAGVAWPTELLVHGYLTLAGAKISKSGLALDPLPLIAAFGADAVRYYLLRHVRTTRDGDFSEARLIEAHDAELANGLGNLANRLFGLLRRSSAGAVPAPGPSSPDSEALRAAALELPEVVDRAVERFALDEALASVWRLVDLANRTLDRSAPWSAIRRGDLGGANAILRALLEVLCVIASELAPFLPTTAERLLRALIPVGRSAGNGLVTGTQLPASLQLFPRIASEGAARSLPASLG
jgi:methionyl-tRNA synthetase